MPFIKFYPDPVPTTTSVDGFINRLNDLPRTWARLHDLAGTGAAAAFDFMLTMIQCQFAADTWVQLCRSIFLFDTSPLPDTCPIVSASIKLFVTAKFNDFPGNSFAFAIYASNPASNVDLQPPDYQCLSSTPLSNLIPYASLPINDWVTFDLNPAGIALINKLGISKFGSREANYDAPNISPIWSSNKHVQVDWATAELNSPAPGVPGPYAPTLTVNYAVLPTVQTDAATATGLFEAKVNGTLIDDGDEACSCHFEWGDTPTLGNTTSLQPGLNSGNSFSAILAGLDSSKTYYFRAVANNSFGTAYGIIRTFIGVNIGAVKVCTLAATGIG